MVKKLKNFRIDESKWIKFQKWCNDNETNASQAILDYIDSCIDRDDEMPLNCMQESIDNCKDKIVVNFHELLEHKEQIKRLKNKIQELEKQEERINKLEQSLSIFADALDSIRSDNYIVRFNLLTKKELQQLARRNNLKIASDLAKDELINVLLENSIYPQWES